MKNRCKIVYAFGVESQGDRLTGHQTYQRRRKASEAVPAKATPAFVLRGRINYYGVPHTCRMPWNALRRSG